MAETKLRTAVKVTSRVAMFSLLLLTFGLISTTTFEAASRYLDRHNYPPPGKLIEVGEYRLHLDCRGEGQPTILLEAGGSQGAIAWGMIQDRLALHHRTCSYDRASMGWSDAGPAEVSPRQTVRDLHRLLRKAGIEGPLILVGHSLGGIYVRLYTALYPDRVRALVLIDSVHEDGLRHLWLQHPALARKMQLNEVDADRLIQAIDWLSPLGIPRLIYRQGLDEYPQRLRSAYAATYFRPARLKASLREIVQLEAKLDSVRNQLGSLGDRPLTVITADRYSMVPGLTEAQSKLVYDNHWAMQSRLLSLSSNSRQIVARGSGHNIQLERPDLVIDAIDRVLQQQAGR